MLPKLATPKYDMIVPSTGKAITYRPYVVKEEKILLIALETQDEDAIEKAVLNIIKECVESPINVNDLTTFDVEFIFITLRSKSVGEGIKLTPRCDGDECEEINEIVINLEKVTVENLKDAPDKHIKLTDDISIDLRWTTMKDRVENLKKDTETETIINMIVTSLETIYSGEDIYAVKDATKKEVVEFVESLNTDQFNDIVEVLSNIPYLSYDMDFDCKKCGKNNTIELRGLIDFFQ